MSNGFTTSSYLILDGTTGATEMATITPGKIMSVDESVEHKTEQATEQELEDALEEAFKTPGAYTISIMPDIFEIAKKSLYGKNFDHTLLRTKYLERVKSFLDS